MDRGRSGSLSVNHSSLFTSAEQFIVSEKCLSIFRRLMQNVAVKEVKHKTGTVKQAFSGQDAVSSCGISNETEVINLLREMMTCNLIRHVSNEKQFENSPSTYFVVTRIGQRALSRALGDARADVFFTKEWSGPSKVDYLQEVCRQMAQDIDVKDRLVGLRNVRSTFIGVDAVDWVCCWTDRTRRLDAVFLLSDMQEQGFLAPVDQSLLGTPFSDTTALYQLSLPFLSMDELDLTASQQLVGTFSDMATAVQRKIGRRPVAVFAAAEKGRRDTVLAAADCFRRVVHPNIVRVWHAFQREGDKVAFVVFEKPSQTFCEALLKTRSWTEAIVSELIRQVTRALDMLHENNLVYGSLCPQAIVLMSDSTLDQNPVVKLCFAETLKPSGVKMAPGSNAAPEAVYSPASDLFSLGIVLHLFLCGFSPNKVTPEGVDMSQASWDLVSESAQILVKTLLRYDPKQRPSAPLLHAHPWLRTGATSQGPQLDAALSLLRSNFTLIPTGNRILSLVSPRAVPMNIATSKLQDEGSSPGGSKETSPVSSARSASGELSSNAPIHILVLGKANLGLLEIWSALYEHHGDLFCTPSSLEDENRFVFDVVTLEDVTSTDGKILWHPRFRGIDGVLLLESMVDCLDQEKAAEAVDRCRSVLLCAHLTHVSIGMFMCHMQQFRHSLVRDQVFGNLEADTPEFNQRENFLIRSITDRFTNAGKERNLVCSLLPSHTATEASSAGGAVAAAPNLNRRSSLHLVSSPAPSSPSMDGRRSYLMRSRVSSMHDIISKYSSLAPQALTESGPDVARKVISSALNDFSKPKYAPSVEDLVRLDNNAVVEFRMSSAPVDKSHELVPYVFRNVPSWLHYISLREGTVEMAFALCSHLPAHLEALHLFAFEFDVRSCEALRASLERTSCRVTSLVLQNAKLHLDCARVLFPALLTNSSLECVDVSNNSLGDEGTQVLADNLIGNFSVRRLFVRSNGLHGKGAVLWKDVLRLNHTLEHLDLSHNSNLVAGNSEQLQLCSSLEVNLLPSLGRLTLSQHVNDALSAQLKKVLDHRKTMLNELPRFAYIARHGKVTSSAADFSFFRLRRLVVDESFTNVTHLNVSKSSLDATSFFESISGLVRLEKLVAIDALLDCVPPSISRLSELRVLCLAQNGIDKLPEDLFSHLTNLEVLDLRFNKLLGLSPSVDKLSELKCLMVQRNSISNFPASLFNLKEISELHCEGNPIHPVLVDIYKVFAEKSTVLDLSGRGLKSLPAEVGMLGRLTELLLADNELSWLPFEVNRLTCLVALDISKNKFDWIPRSISMLPLTLFKFDNNPLRYESSELQLHVPLQKLLATLESLRQRDKNVVPSKRARVFIVGDAHSGKSSIAKSLCPSMGEGAVAMGDWEVEEGCISVLDFAGSSCRDVFPVFLSDHVVFVLTFSLANDVEHMKSVRYWLENLRLSSPRSPVVVVGTHLDGVDAKGGPLAAKIREMTSKFSNVKGFVMTSQSNKKLADVTSKVLAVLKAQERFEVTVSFSLYELEKSLELKRQSRNPPVLLLDEVTSICQQLSISNVDQALRTLHDMGSIVYLAGNSTVVLDIAWLSKVMMSMFKVKSSTIDGWVGHTQFEHAWRAYQVAPSSVETVLSVLAEMKVVAKVRDGQYCVPAILSDERPGWLWGFLVAALQGESISDVRRLYSFEFARIGFFSRFLGHLATLVQTLRMWKNVVFAELRDGSGTKLMVEYHVGHVGSGTLDVRLRGPSWAEGLKRVGEVLREMMDESKTTESFPTFCKGCNDTHIVAKAEVDGMAKSGRLFYVCPNNYHIVFGQVCPELESILAPPATFDASTAEEYSTCFVALSQEVSLRDSWMGGCISHPNIAWSLGVVEATDDTRGIYFEGADLALLNEVLSDSSIKMDWRLVLRIALDVVEALRCAHSCVPPMRHGNLSVSTIMIDSIDTSTEVVARVFGFNITPRTEGDDILAFGAILVHLVTRTSADLSAMPKWCPLPYVTLAKACLDPRPETRPSLRDIRADLLDMEGSTARMGMAFMKAASDITNLSSGSVPMLARTDSVDSFGLTTSESTESTSTPSTPKKVRRKGKKVLRKRVKRASRALSKASVQQATAPPSSEVAPTQEETPTTSTSPKEVRKVQSDQEDSLSGSEYDETELMKQILRGEKTN